MSIRDELLAIQGTDEFLVVERAHEWARANTNSDLFKALEWNNQIAGREFRYSQIRRLIAIHLTTEEGLRSVMSLSIDRAREGGGYRKLNDILADQSLHEIMLADALRELERVQAKYNSLAALAPIWQAVAGVRRRRGRRGGTQVAAAGSV